MGHRREGFLTLWQWEYVKDRKKVVESRQRIEDYYIFKQWEKTRQQLFDIIPWLEKKRKAVPDYVYFINSFYPQRGRPRLGTKSRQQKVECPICNAEITMYIDKKGQVQAKIATGGVPKERRIILGRVKIGK
jgi:hypothetical protein